jgi:hypothetical protein
LSPNTSYSFRVRAGNGCATGSWSGVKSALTANKLARGIIIEKITTGHDPPKECSYTIKPKDTLWDIARDTLGKGSLYQKIIEKNIGKYPSIASSLKVGAVIALPCEEEPIVLEDKYKLNIKVIAQGRPLSGVNIKLYPSLPEATTDQNGWISLSDIQKGEYVLGLEYQGQKTEQKIIVEGSNKEQNITLNISLRKNIIPAWVGISILLTIVSGIIYWYRFIPIRKRRVILKKIRKKRKKVFLV